MTSVRAWVCWPRIRARMKDVEWLDAIGALIAQRAPEVEVSRPDDDTLGLVLGLRGVVIHTTGRFGFLTGSVAAGRTTASQLSGSVINGDPLKFVVEPATLQRTVLAALEHLMQLVRIQGVRYPQKSGIAGLVDFKRSRGAICLLRFRFCRTVPAIEAVTCSHPSREIRRFPLRTSACR